MLEWCSSCRSEVRALFGKGNLAICQQCGCELRPAEAAPDGPNSGLPTDACQVPTHAGPYSLGVEPAPMDADWEPPKFLVASDLVTQEKFAAFVDFENGLAQFPGQWAMAQSAPGAVPEVPLMTARYLPAEFFAEEARLADQISNLNEQWESDQLLERICNLEQSLLIVESSGQVQPEAAQPPSSGRPGSDVAPPKSPTQPPRTKPVVGAVSPTPLVRIDRGHVVAPAQRGTAASNGLAKSSLSKVTEPVRESGHRSLAIGEREHRFDLPIATPIASIDTRAERAGVHVPPDATPFVATWSPEARLMTCLGLGSAWAVQLIIGLASLASGPLPIWSVWIVAQTLGSICLGRVFWQILAPGPIGSEEQEFRGGSIPGRHASGQRETVRSARSADHEPRN